MSEHLHQQRHGDYSAFVDELVQFICEQREDYARFTKEQILMLMEISVLATAFVASTKFESFSGTTVLRKLLEAKDAMVRAFEVELAEAHRVAPSAEVLP